MPGSGLRATLPGVNAIGNLGKSKDNVIALSREYAEDWTGINTCCM